MSDFVPHVTVATVVDRGGRFLLVEEYSNGHKVLNQPAGHLEPNETLVEGACREVLEETGWQVEVTDKWLRNGNPWEIPRPEVICKALRRIVETGAKAIMQVGDQHVAYPLQNDVAVKRPDLVPVDIGKTARHDTGDE